MTDKRDDAEGFVCHQVSKDAPEMTVEEAANTLLFEDYSEAEVISIIQAQRQEAVRSAYASYVENACKNYALLKAEVEDNKQKIRYLLAEKSLQPSPLAEALARRNELAVNVAGGLYVAENEDGFIRFEISGNQIAEWVKEFKEAQAAVDKLMGEGYD